MKIKKIAYWATLLFILPGLLSCQPMLNRVSVPIAVPETLYDFSQPDTLGLTAPEGLATSTVYKPADGSDSYVNGAVAIGFKGHLYVQWQSSDKDEDSADTWVAYSRSANMVEWEAPQALAPSWDKGIKTSGGWWTDGNTLVAYVNVWPKGFNRDPGYIEYRTTTDGIHWSEPKVVTNNKGERLLGIIEQDMRALPNGRIMTAVHVQPGLIATPYYTDDPLGITDWTKGILQNLPYDKSTSREIEPAWFYRPDGSVVMIFRDQASSFKKLASVSKDNGVTWSTPVVTEVPDSRSKQCAGNLPDGTAFMVSNPAHDKTRIPLVISLSKHGRLFNKAYLLRAGGEDLQAMQFSGRYKRTGYNYPKATVWKDHLYVAYATNKEEIEVSQIPISSLQ